jgi:hypothetical protein
MAQGKGLNQRIYKDGENDSEYYTVDTASGRGRGI